MKTASTSARGWWVVGGLVALLVALHDGPSPGGWMVYLAIGAGLGFGFGKVWRAIAGPAAGRSLIAAVAVGFALRLGAGVVWRTWLPTLGNDEPHHRAGVFYPDAFVRDRSGWTIGRTDVTLLDAFDNAKGDQYGTLLFLTASVYRVFGPQVQTTVLPAALASGVGTLTVLLTWGFSTRLFGRRAAELAAWTVALYPDAVFLSAEPMREPFVMAGLAGALHGYALIRDGPARGGLPWIVGGIAVCLAVSPPFGVAGALIIAGAALWEGRLKSPATRWIVPGAILMAVLALLLTVRAWAGIEGSPDPGQGLLGWWIDGVRFQMDKLYQASGWVQEVFGQTPTWSHVPLATGYGLVQPLLPAALMDNTGRAFMSAVMSLRAGGWFAVLPVLIYAPLGSIRREGRKGMAVYLTLVFLAAAILVSYRFAGDQWDSPRYRAALIPILGALVGWAWRGQSGQVSPWLKWTYGLVGIETLIIGWWYAGRFYHIPRLSLFRTLGVAGFIGIVYLGLAGWLEARRRQG